MSRCTLLSLSPSLNVLKSGTSVDIRLTSVATFQSATDLTPFISTPPTRSVSTPHTSSPPCFQRITTNRPHPNHLLLRPAPPSPLPHPPRPPHLVKSASTSARLTL